MNKQISLSLLHIKRSENTQAGISGTDGTHQWGELEELVKLYYYGGKRGNKPYDLKLMLHLLIIPKRSLIQCASSVARKSFFTPHCTGVALTKKSIIESSHMKKVNYIQTVKNIWKSMVYHTPKEMLSAEQRKDIVRNGLVHFTKSSAVASIMENGLVYDSSRAMKRAEKKMVWAYIYDPEDPKKHLEVIRSKGDRSSTDAVIIIKGISEEQLNNMRCRPKLDDAIAHIGNLKTADMAYEIF